MANLFLTGNHLPLSLGWCLNPGSGAKPMGRTKSGRRAGRLGTVKYAGLCAENFFFPLVDNCLARLQWRVLRNDNIHKRPSR
jgi:hypothetical protein